MGLQKGVSHGRPLSWAWQPVDDKATPLEARKTKQTNNNNIMTNTTTSTMMNTTTTSTIASAAALKPISVIMTAICTGITTSLATTTMTNTTTTNEDQNHDNDIVNAETETDDDGTHPGNNDQRYDINTDDDNSEDYDTFRTVDVRVIHNDDGITIGNNIGTTTTSSHASARHYGINDTTNSTMSSISTYSSNSQIPGAYAIGGTNFTESDDDTRTLVVGSGDSVTTNDVYLSQQARILEQQLLQTTFLAEPVLEDADVVVMVTTNDDNSNGPVLEGQVIKEESSMDQNADSSRIKLQHLIIGGCLMIVMATIATVMVLFVGPGDGSPTYVDEHIPSSENSIMSSSNATSSPTFTPTTTPIPYPMPMTQRMSMLLDFFYTVPGVDTSALQNSTSRQYRAIEWLANEDKMQLSPVENLTYLIERYALVSLYLTTNAEHTGIRPVNWLSGLSHCQWILVKCDEHSNQVTQLVLGKLA